MLVAQQGGPFFPCEAAILCILHCLHVELEGVITVFTSSGVLSNALCIDLVLQAK